MRMFCVGGFEDVDTDVDVDFAFLGGRGSEEGGGRLDGIFAARSSICLYAWLAMSLSVECIAFRSIEKLRHNPLSWPLRINTLPVFHWSRKYWLFVHQHRCHSHYP